VPDRDAARSLPQLTAASLETLRTARYTRRDMSIPETLTPTIVDTLYERAMDLSEEARELFEWAKFEPATYGEDDTIRVALSCEALRTTTRLMHMLAWLLNHRAFFAGEMSELQLRRHGRLPPAQPLTNPVHLAHMDPAIIDVITESVALYDRIERLDHACGDDLAEQPAEIHRLHDRLGEAYSAG